MTTQTPAGEGQPFPPLPPPSGVDPAYWAAAVARFRTGYIVDPVSKCWVWQGKPDGAGYPRFRHGGRRWRRWPAHRFSLELYRGPIPDGLQALHGCDNKMCVNPAHLRAGTPKENAQDAVDRGLLRNGPGSNPRKLTGRDALTVFGMKMNGCTIRQIADAFEVSTDTIKAVLSGKAHIEAIEVEHDRWVAEQAAETEAKASAAPETAAELETTTAETAKAETVP